MRYLVLAILLSMISACASNGGRIAAEGAVAGLRGFSDYYNSHRPVQTHCQTSGGITNCQSY